MKIKSYYLLPLFFIFFCSSYGQEKFELYDSYNSFRNSLTSNISKMNTFYSDFTQTKFVSYLNMQVVSKGKYYLKKPDKLRWEYSSPYNYVIIIRDGKVIFKNSDNSDDFKVKSGQVFEQVNKILKLSMTGNFSSSEDFKYTLFVSDNFYKVVLEIPAENRELFSKFELFFEKNRYSLRKIKMFEINGDYTEIVFVNPIINEVLSEDLFN